MQALTHFHCLFERGMCERRGTYVQYICTVHFCVKVRKAILFYSNTKKKWSRLSVRMCGGGDHTRFISQRKEFQEDEILDQATDAFVVPCFTFGVMA